MSQDFLSPALWGRLFSDPEVAARFAPDALCARMLAFERAWTRGLGQAGLAERTAVAAALAAIDGFRFEPGHLAEATERDGLPVPGLVRRLREGLDEDAMAAIHRGATSQDVLDTAMVLIAGELLTLFGQRIGTLLGRIGTLKDRFGDAPLTGRTRMQAALPITVADRLDTWARPLARHQAAVGAVIEDLSVLQAGGPVGRRDGLGEYWEAVSAHVAAELGLVTGDVWHTDRTGVVDAGHWLAKVAGTLGKIGQDVALMAQQGIGAARLEDGGGSSAMPHKSNPVRAEILVAEARVVAGLQATLAQGMVHEQERSGAAWAMEWMTLPAMFDVTGAALGNADRLLGQVVALGDGAGG